MVEVVEVVWLVGVVRVFRVVWLVRVVRLVGVVVQKVKMSPQEKKSGRSTS